MNRTTRARKHKVMCQTLIILSPLTMDLARCPHNDSWSVERSQFVSFAEQTRLRLLIEWAKQFTQKASRNFFMLKLVANKTFTGDVILQCAIFAYQQVSVSSCLTLMLSTTATIGLYTEWSTKITCSDRPHSYVCVTTCIFSVIAVLSSILHN